MARAALEEARLDRLIFIPAAQSPFKPDQPLAPAAERVRWLRLALAGWTQCRVDTREVERGGVSYTIETVRACVAEAPGATWFWLLGGDHVPLLPLWREAEALAGLVEFLVVNRPGAAPASLPAPFRLRHLTGVPTGISASMVRERVRAGLPLEPWVPPAVAEAIRHSGLYL